MSAVILFGLFLAFTYKPGKKGLKRELGFFLLPAVGPQNAGQKTRSQ